MRERRCLASSSGKVHHRCTIMNCVGSCPSSRGSIAQRKVAGVFVTSGKKKKGSKRGSRLSRGKKKKKSLILSRVTALGGGGDGGEEGQGEPKSRGGGKEKEARNRGDALRASRDKSEQTNRCLLYTSPSPRDATLSRMPSSA